MKREEYLNNMQLLLDELRDYVELYNARFPTEGQPRNVILTMHQPINVINRKIREARSYEVHDMSK